MSFCGLAFVVDEGGLFSLFRRIAIVDGWWIEYDQRIKMYQEQEKKAEKVDIEER
eukprot:m.38602 g.38602  ORF g.38602 m.38602 type:complete len:55 (+) comp11498_c0_seq1:948-1112(+)